MSLLNHALTIFGQVVVKTILLFHVVIGTMANIFLFCHNLSPGLSGHRLRPTHVILSHLAVANSLVLLSCGIPHIIVAFGIRYRLSSLGCKCVFYIHRVGRGASLCSTSVLSSYQAVTLNPMTKGWTIIQGKVSKAIGPSCCFCWMFSILSSIYTFLTTTNPKDPPNNTHSQGQWFCTYTSINVGLVVLWSVSDAVLIGLMVWASGSMVLLLWRHHYRTQHIHSFVHPHKDLHVTRATHTILILVFIFVTFYALNSIIVFYVTTFVGTALWLMSASQLTGSCFPTLSPLVIIFRDPKFYSAIIEVLCLRENT